MAKLLSELVQPQQEEGEKKEETNAVDEEESEMERRLAALA